MRPIGNVKILDFKNVRHGPATIGLPPLRFMLRQEAGGDKEIVGARAPKVIHYDWKKLI